MASIDPSRNNVPNGDELDDIFNDAIFDTSDLQPQQQQETQTQRKTPATRDEVNIDEEIKIVKKRTPIPKLDDSRLLSAAGIPKLRRISKERSKFKGKGHEYGDIARMLNMYQLWLDDLYPRAKFADGLAMIEKLGHSKRIGYMRKEWIDEGKPKTSVGDDPEETETAQPDEADSLAPEQMEGVVRHTIEEEPRLSGRRESLQQGPGSPRTSGGADPDEDELDALLAETAAPNSALTSAISAPRIANMEEDLFAEEMEAMAEMEGMW